MWRQAFGPHSPQAQRSPPSSWPAVPAPPALTPAAGHPPSQHILTSLHKGHLCVPCDPLVRPPPTHLPAHPPAPTHFFWRDVVVVAEQDVAVDAVQGKQVGHRLQAAGGTGKCCSEQGEEAAGSAQEGSCELASSRCMRQAAGWAHLRRQSGSTQAFTAASISDNVTLSMCARDSACARREAEQEVQGLSPTLQDSQPAPAPTPDATGASPTAFSWRPPAPIRPWLPPSPARAAGTCSMP